jgi:predicted nucleotidyltransferase
MKKRFRSFIKESIIDPVQSNYSKDVFFFDGQEHRFIPRVRDYLLNRIEELRTKSVFVDDVAIIGSLMTKRYTEDSDLDVNLLIPKTKSETEFDVMRGIAARESYQLLPGTKHPVNFHVLDSREEFEDANQKADAVFNLSQNKFIKEDTSKSINILNYLPAFQKQLRKVNLLINDLKDDAFDYSLLKQADTNSVAHLYKEINKEIKALEKDAVNLVDYYEAIKQQRRDAFKRPLSTKEIREFGSKNKLPENVIYKLLERYYYLNFLHKVQEILGDDYKLSDSEADDLVQLVLKKS